MTEAGKAGQSRTGFGTSACLCWFKVYINNSLCVQFNVLCYLIGAVAERGDPTPLLLSAVCSHSCSSVCSSGYVAAG